MKQPTRLTQYLKEIGLYIPEYEKTNTTISQSTVGWQLDHTLKVINNVIVALIDAPTNKTPKVTSVGRLLLLIRHIPRGRGKAPKQVLPPEHIEKEAIEKQLSQAKESLKLIAKIDSKATFKHPVFGILNKKQTIRFIEVHTNHHLKIVRDILKK